MTNAPKVPTQHDLDSCRTMADKFLLKKPELCYGLNERDYSKLFSEITRPYLRYNITLQKWMYYNGKYWEVDTSNVHVQKEMKNFSYELLKYALNSVGSKNEEFIEFAKDLGSASKRKSLIKDAIDVNFITDNSFDQNPYLFNCINGTFNLQSMALQPFNPNDFITKLSNVYYDAQKTSFLLDSFMSEIFCYDKDLIDYVYQVLGYCLSGINNQESFWILLGESTRNGKSTLLNTISYMLGGSEGYSRNFDVSTLARKKSMNGSAPSSDICRLKNSRFVVASEPPQDFILDEAKIKAFSGNDRITARALYSSEIEFIPTFKIFLATNHKPNVLDDSVLESKRLKVIPFNRHFEPHEQNKNLKFDLCHPDVISALFNKCVQGWNQFATNGLIEPQAIIDATSTYQTSGQILQSFLDSELVTEPGAVVALSTYYPLYEAWCTENGFMPMTREKVNHYVRSKGMFRATATINGKTVRNILSGYRLPAPNENIVAQVTLVTEPQKENVSEPININLIQKTKVETEPEYIPVELVQIPQNEKDIEPIHIDISQYPF